MSSSTALIFDALLGVALIVSLLGLLGHYGIRKGVEHDRFLLAMTRLRFRRRRSAG